MNGLETASLKTANYAEKVRKYELGLKSSVDIRSCCYFSYCVVIYVPRINKYVKVLNCFFIKVRSYHWLAKEATGWES